jgi:hypothetical protein
MGNKKVCNKSNPVLTSGILKFYITEFEVAAGIIKK